MSGHRQPPHRSAVPWAVIDRPYSAHQSLITRPFSGNVAACETDLIVLEADELHQVDVRAHQLGRKLQLNRPRKGSRVVEGEFVDERPVVDARPPFDGVQLLRVWGAATIEPELLVIAYSVDDERTAV